MSMYGAAIETAARLPGNLPPCIRQAVESNRRAKQNQDAKREKLRLKAMGNSSGAAGTKKQRLTEKEHLRLKALL
jgi:hypothetical protein